MTRKPVQMYRGVKLGRLAIRCEAFQKLSEVAPFLALIGRPRTIVEIGAGKGGMLAAFCAGSEAGRDDRLRRPGGQPIWWGASDALLRSPGEREAGPEAASRTWYSLDPAIRERTAALTPNGVDVLLIDGDHSYEGVSGDFRIYSPLVVPGGIVALHDIGTHSVVTTCEVDRLWASPQ